MWNVTGSGIDPVSPALVGRFFTTGPPGMSYFPFLKKCLHWVVWLCRVLIVARGIFCFSTWTPVVAHGCRECGSLYAALVLSCFTACGILVPQPGIQPISPALPSRFLTTGPPEKSQHIWLLKGGLYGWIWPHDINLLHLGQDVLNSEVREIWSMRDP